MAVSQHRSIDHRIIADSPAAGGLHRTVPLADRVRRASSRQGQCQDASGISCESRRMARQQQDEQTQVRGVGGGSRRADAQVPVGPVDAGRSTVAGPWVLRLSLSQSLCQVPLSLSLPVSVSLPAPASGRRRWSLGRSVAPSLCLAVPRCASPSLFLPPSLCLSLPLSLPLPLPLSVPPSLVSSGLSSLALFPGTSTTTTTTSTTSSTTFSSSSPSLFFLSLFFLHHPSTPSIVLLAPLPLARMSLRRCSKRPSPS